MKKHCFLSIFLVFLVVSCASIKEPENLYSDIDYTQEEARAEESKRINELLKTNSVQAFWRANLLQDDSVIEKCAEVLIEEFNKALEEEDYFNARRIFISLSNSSYKNLSSLSKNGRELEELYLKKVPGANSKPSSTPIKKVSSLIDGTVTIWVDKGIKVERGMGIADRVIGSGFFISKDGYIITNNHVIEDVVDKKSSEYTKLYIKLAEDSDTKIPAKVIGWDPEVDLALLKTEVDAPYVFALGSSEDLDIGDKIYAIGSPVGLERTLTSGIVSADDRKLFTIGSVLQIDAAVNSGNSGGPCIDGNGNVQAIVFAGMLQFEGLNFAIPVEYLKSLLPSLYAGGKISHPWIGCFGHTKKELGKNAGLEVQYCLPGGSASRAKIKVGDVIVELNGQKITTLEEYQSVMMKCVAKSIVNIKVRHSDETETVHSIYLAVRPEQPGYVIYKGDIFAHAALPIFGMGLTSVSTSSSRKYSINTIIKGSIADEYNFAENDPIEVYTVKTNEKNTAIYAEVYTKNQKKGYLDISMAFSAALDSPYYF
ncbi:MAG: trypsin-like peptidase domain-containing protein [Treponema sp.]|nr:trypsin-like peptidase domain-containing protein [Candidatus Treponema equifaecale]